MSFSRRSLLSQTYYIPQLYIPSICSALYLIGLSGLRNPSCFEDFFANNANFKAVLSNVSSFFIRDLLLVNCINILPKNIETIHNLRKKIIDIKVYDVWGGRTLV